MKTILIGTAFLLAGLLLGKAQYAAFDECDYSNTPGNQEVYFATLHKTALLVSGTNTSSADMMYTFNQSIISLFPTNQDDDAVAGLASDFLYQCGAYGHGGGPNFGNEYELAEILNEYLDGTLDTSEEGIAAISENHTATSYKDSVTWTNSITVTKTVSGSVLDQYTISSDINHGLDTGICGCHSTNGMPRWFITEPYLNLWVNDTPVSYRTSLGQEISFRMAYKQHDTRPLTTCVPPTGWNHNWFSYVHFVVPTHLASTNGTVGVSMTGSTYPFVMALGWRFTNDFSQWQAILYSSDSGENYFSQNGMYDYQSGTQLVPNGSDASTGFKLIHPDGSVDEYTVASSRMPYSYGMGHLRGGYVEMTNAPQEASFGSMVAYCTNNATTTGATTGTGNYEMAVSTTPNIGEAVGYVACDALLTKRIDPYGNAIVLNYTTTGTNYYLKSIIDYDGKQTTLSYDLLGMLTNVSMPYGRSASFIYNSNSLIQVTDAQGMSSSFSYASFSYMDGTVSQANTYLSRMTTPYGTTAFDHYEAPPTEIFSNVPSLQYSGGGGGPMVTCQTSSNLWVGWYGGTNRVNKACHITNPDGSQELYLYRYDARGFVPNKYPTGQIPGGSQQDDGVSDAGEDSPGAFDHLLSARDSFYWNPQQYAALSTNDFLHFTAADYGLARMQHWLEEDSTETFFPFGTEWNVSADASLIRDPSPDGVQDGMLTWNSYPDQSGWKVPGPVGVGGIISSSILLPNNDIRGQQLYVSVSSLPSVDETFTTPYGSTSTRQVGAAYDNFGHVTSISLPGQGINVTMSYSPAYSSNYQQMACSDAYGATTYYYNGRHQLAGIQHENGLTTTNFYGSDGFLTQSIDLQTHATNTYTFANGLPATRVTPSGVTLTYTWDNLDRLTSVGFPDGTTISNVYSRLDRVAHKDRLNQWTYASYDSLGRLASSTDARGKVTQYSFCGCGALGSVTDPLGNATVYNRDYDGNVIEEVSSDGFVTGYQRNVVGEIVGLTNSAGLSLSFLYNNQGLVTNASSPYGQVFSALYDYNDYPVQLTDAQGVSVTNSFDSLGQLLWRENAYGVVERNGYSGQGITSRQGAYYNNLTTYNYTSWGQLTSVVDGQGNITQFGYDVLGDLTALTNGSGKVTLWGYDPYGRAVSKINGNGVLAETNGYNADGWRTAHWTPAMGLTQYGYDPNGNVTGVTYSGSPGMTASYDSLNRISTMNDVLGAHSFSYQNFGPFQGALATEAGPWATVARAYANRLPRSLSLGTWTESYGFDSLMRLQSVASPAGSFGYGYSGAGRLVQTINLPGGSQIANTYDGAGNMGQTALQNGLTSLDSYGYTYDKNGNRTSVTRVNNASVAYGYDAIGELVSAVGQEADSLLRGNENFGYGYDAAGNLLARTNNTLIQAFTMDNANELVNVSSGNNVLTVAGSLTNTPSALSVNGQAATIYGDQTFAVAGGVALNDGANTFTAVVTSAGVTMTNLWNQNLPASQNLSYDLNGNLISDGVHGYDYDCANELIRVTATNQWKVEYTYDGLGRRCIRRESTWAGTSGWLNANEVHYVYDGFQVLRELTVLNTPKVTYTRGSDLGGTMGGAGGIGGLLARTDANGSAYYHSDGNGNVTMLVDGSGNVLAKYLYDPFGNTLGAWGTLATANTYRFSSKEIEPRTGQYYYGYRFYDPNLQRWLNQDPIQEAGGINLYAYVGNSPINRVDPYGLRIILAGDGAPPSGFSFNLPQPDSDWLADFGDFALAANQQIANILSHPGNGIAGAELEGPLMGMFENDLPEAMNPLHPDAKPYPDPNKANYKPPCKPTDRVRDHIVARAHEGSEDEGNIDSKSRESNAIKGGREGQLLQYEQYLLDNGVPQDIVDQITAPEWRSIENDVHARATDPSLLDKLPAPDSGQ